jgi:hypothetical protein
MNSKGSTSTALRGRLTRALALFFVLFTVVDIAAQPYCCDELPASEIGVGAAADRGALRTDEPARATDEDEDEQEPDSDTAPGCEDCCFSCARALAGTHFSGPGRQDARSHGPAKTYGRPPTPELPRAYHPPRAA